MQKFKFPLEGAMQYRQLQIDLQRAKLESLYSELSRLNSREKALVQEKEFADSLIKGVDPCFALSLMALDNFSRHARQEQTAIERQRADCFQKIAQQQVALLDAQRDYDLLAKMRERKIADWQRGASAEEETVAAEAHMARVARENSRNRSRTDGSSRLN